MTSLIVGCMMPNHNCMWTDITSNPTGDWCIRFLSSFYYIKAGDFAVTLLKGGGAETECGCEVPAFPTNHVTNNLLQQGRGKEGMPHWMLNPKSPIHVDDFSHAQQS